MRITDVECIHLCFRYESIEGYTPIGTIDGRLSSLVRVHTDGGLSGVGSCYSLPGVVQATVDHLKPFVVGFDPVETEKHWARLHSVANWYGRKGGAVSALGAIDIALWDLRGKIEGQPVWKLLGGTEGKAPAYASGMMYDEPDAVAAVAARCIESGFRRVKTRAGRTWDDDVATVAAIKRAIGKENDLIVDGIWRLDLASAIAFAEVLAEHDVFWFEEPFRVDQIDDFVALRAESTVPLASGENEFSLSGFREHVRFGTVDILQADASRAGGITEVVKVAEMADEAGLGLAPHSWSDAVAIVANAHAVAAAPNGVTCEVDQTGNGLVDELLREPLDIQDGQLDLGDKPGLGIELDETKVEQWRLADPYNVPDGSYSDIIYGRGRIRYIGDYVGPTASAV